VLEPAGGGRLIRSSGQSVLLLSSFSFELRNDSGLQTPSPLTRRSRRNDIFLAWCTCGVWVFIAADAATVRSHILVEKVERTRCGWACATPPP
jgi:hypothetical protein